MNPAANGPQNSSAPLFKEGQRKVVAYALTFAAFTLIVVLVVGCFWILGAIVSTFSGVLWPLAVAGILALVLRPAVELIEERLKIRRLGAVIIVAGILVLVFLGFLVLVVPPAINQILELITYLPTLWRDLLEYLRGHYPRWVTMLEQHMQNPALKSLADQASAEAQSVLKWAVPSLKAAGSRLMAVLTFGTQLAVVPIYLFFFLLSRGQPADKLPQHLPFLAPALRNDVVFLVREFVSIIVSFFRGQLLIGLIMGLLYAAGFTVVGLKFGAVVGMLLGLLNIVPYLGSIIGLVVTIPLALFQPDGGWELVWKMLAVQVVVQNVEGWVLTPKIMSDRTGLHPVVVIVAIFFWGTALEGVLGMVLAIPLTAFFVTAWRLAKRKYFGGGGLEGIGHRV